MKSIVERLDRFVVGTTRGRKYVKCIRLKKEHYEEYRRYLEDLKRYPTLDWEIKYKCLFFIGIVVVKHPWL